MAQGTRYRGIIGYNVQSFKFFLHWKRSGIQRFVIHDQHRLIFRKLFFYFKPHRFMFVFRTGILAFHATKQAVVRWRFNKSGKWSGMFIMKCDTQFRMEEETVFVYCPGGACWNACPAGTASFHETGLSPGFIVTRKIRAESHEPEIASFSGDVAHIIPAIFCHSASYCQLF